MSVLPPLAELKREIADIDDLLERVALVAVVSPDSLARRDDITQSLQWWRTRSVNLRRAREGAS